MPKFTTQVKELLEEKKQMMTYGEIAVLLGSGAQAVGSAMRALSRRGFNELCGLVIFKNSN
ncbi:MGMT family protein [Bdellovibrio bacteriovorus]|uniref:MGMT family protein n=1 Tax=Bdellovibrio bacteriovorus TaxID=959 RepID=UPI0035A6354A